MNDVTFDALSRRASLLGVGAGLAALAMPFSADAKNKGKKKAKQKCRSQVEPCSTLVGESNCGPENDPDCLAQISACCQLLANCDFTGLIACIQPT